MARKELAPGVGRLSRSQAYARRQLYKGKKTGTAPAAPETAPTKEVQVGGDKNGASRLVPTSKAPRFYPAEDVRKPKQSRKAAKPTQLRDSIAPGSVLILLAGRFRGKRVVFLKQLESGLLLVTGPYKVNGVPLRRVNQAYVIATSTKIPLGSDFKVDPKINDAYFAKSEKKRSRSAEEEFFADGKPKEKEAFPESKAADQKEVDKAVLAAVKSTELLAKYLKSSWGLSKGEYPHQLKF
ncbi:ribosomal protein L6e-domain-containing protein [Gloeopeniophorella convolvens]|nr:ribosomal protein L6e-domain-containing protein [Gloeopeniophorella convolvens]